VALVKKTTEMLVVRRKSTVETQTRTQKLTAMSLRANLLDNFRYTHAIKKNDFNL